MKKLIIGLSVVLGAVLFFASAGLAQAVSWEKIPTEQYWTAANVNKLAFAPSVWGGHMYLSMTSSAGAEVWRSSGGTDWERVSSGGFGDTHNFFIEDFAIFNGDLYAVAANFVTGTEVWRTRNGTDWNQVGGDGFGDPNNIAEFVALEVFDGRLYAGTGNHDTGVEIWRTENGTDWSQANQDNFGETPLSEYEVFDLYAFDGQLYCGTVAVSGGSIWRTDNGTSWNRLVDNGFGDAHNYSIGSFVKFQNTLYAFTYNDETGTEAWRFDDGETWSQVNTDGFGNAETYWVFMRPVVADGRLYVGYTNPHNGAGVFSTANGVDWTVEMSDGQGDINSYAIYGMALWGDRIYTAYSSYDSAKLYRSDRVNIYPQGYLVTAAGAGAAPWVRRFNAYGQERTPPSNLMAFASTFRGGVNVATGDLDGDDIDEIVVAPRGNGAPQVRVFGQDGQVKFNSKGFYAYDKNLRCGADVAVADVDGNGTNEIVTIPGTGCGPQVKVFDANGDAVLTLGFFAYAKGMRAGARLSAGDVNQDGRAEIVTIPDHGVPGQVRIFDYTGKVKGTAGFYPYGTQRTGGDVAVADLNADGKDEIITVPGEGFPAQVRIFDSTGKAKLNPGFFAYQRSLKTGFLVNAGDLNRDGQAEIVTVPKTGAPAQVRTFKYNGAAIFTPGFYAYAASQKAGGDVTVGNF